MTYEYQKGIWAVEYQGDLEPCEYQERKMSEGLPKISLDTLPDDALRSIISSLRCQAEELSDVMRLFRTCQRLQAFTAHFDELELCMLINAPSRTETTRHEGRGGLLFVSHPLGVYGCTAWRRAAPLLMPYPWAARLSGLSAIEITHLSWPGAARLVGLLPAWPRLEQLELRFEYALHDVHAVTVRFQELADDLAGQLRLGAVPRLRYLWLGHVACSHCFGQRWVHQRN